MNVLSTLAMCLIFGTGETFGQFFSQDFQKMETSLTRIAQTKGDVFYEIKTEPEKLLFLNEFAAYWARLAKIDIAIFETYLKVINYNQLLEGWIQQKDLKKRRTGCIKIIQFTSMLTDSLKKIKPTPYVMNISQVASASS